MREKVIAVVYQSAIALRFSSVLVCYYLSIEDFIETAKEAEKYYAVAASEIRKAGYLLDRLRGYNCISKSQKRKLASLVKKVEESRSEIVQDVDYVDNLEPLAKKWYLNYEVN